MADQDPNATPQDGQAGADKYAGKTLDEVKVMHQNAEKKIGEQGAIIGQLKQAKATPPAPAEPDFAKAKAEIHKALNDGDLSPEEAVQKLDDINQQMMGYMVNNTLAKKDQENAFRNDAAKFQNNYPDFVELRDSGALTAIKAELPNLHDDMSAYYELKLRQAKQAATTAHDEGYQKGLKERKALDDGSKETEMVIGDDGSGTRKAQPKKPSQMNEHEKTDKMLDSLNKFRRNQAGG